MDRRDAVRLSKFLSLVLRHRPDEYRLEMDELGYVDFESLIDVLAAEDIVGADAEQVVMDLVEGSERRRFAVDDGRIRALYGHSSRVNLNYPHEEAPATLFHGTTVEVAREIAEKGIKPAGRAYVHLSQTEEEALSIGGRHTDDPILIKIDTAAAVEHGLGFYHATGLIWLCQDVPADVCDVPELPEPSEEEEAPAPARRSVANLVSPQANPPVSSSVQRIEPETGGEFKRRTRKKKGRR
jgi:putative RNA 2'-phosphotransferase